MNYLEFLLPTGMAVMLGGGVGLKRQIRGHAAGLRTHMLVSLSAAIFVLACKTMTRMQALESAVALSRSFPHSLFEVLSTSTTRHSSPSQTFARTFGEFSPTPPVNTNASMSAIVTANAPMAWRTRWQYMSMASRAHSFPASAAASTSRMPAEIPETPSKPEL